MRPPRALPIVCFVLGILLSAPAVTPAAEAPLPASVHGELLAYNVSPPPTPQKLIFIHHSTGGNWLADPAGNSQGGDLGRALMNNNYYASATNYGWTVEGDVIGDRTDIGHWWEWFRGPNSATFLSALYNENGQNFGDYGIWPRLAADPGGQNTIIMFKSCFPCSYLGGTPSDPPTTGANPLQGQDCSSETMTVANAKGIYVDLLNYFQAHPEKLFIVIVQPPQGSFDTDSFHAANARALAEWLVNDWLDSYPLHNVFVFDFFNVLTSNGGSNRMNDPNTNDLGWADGNHHRYRNGTIENMKTVNHNFSAYADSGDSHPTMAGNEKATGEFIQLLNLAYHCWKGTGDCPGGAPACTLTCTASVPATGTTGNPVAFQSTATATNCTGSLAFDWDFGDGTSHASSQNPTHAYAAVGTYTWTLTATVSGATPCTQSGGITVSDAATCTVSCTASASPTSGTAPLTVTFTGSATTANCAGGVTYAWNFGDGSASTLQSPTHTYATAGTHTWSFSATADSVTCTQTGTVTVTGGGEFQTYHVRTDGGDASQCTGLADAAYPGSGTGQPCAWKHPFYALPPGGPARIAGGDTLVIHAGSYRMGYSAPGAEACAQEYPWDCLMVSVPSGPDATHPTRIIGEMTGRGCTAKPELWGTERAYHIVDLHGSSHVELACLDITDHSSCIEDHNQSNFPCSGCTVRCNRDSFPYGDWAMSGISGRDSVDVRITDVDIHGLANMGVHAGRISNWTLERVKILGNGSAGWNGDLWENSSNSGTIFFRNVEIAYNGCSEAYPAETITMDTCWGQEAGGYGDGLGTATTGGSWIFEDCKVHHNTSDGLDLLYLDPSASIEVRRLWAEGNAGNQLKTSGPAIVENSILIGNCAYFEGQPLMQEGDHCRAAGNTLSLDVHRGSQVTLVNDTVTGQGDCLLIVGCNDSYPEDPDPNCDGTERVLVRNTLFYGNPEWRQAEEMTCLSWYDDSLLPADPLSLDYNLIYRVKDDPCPGTHDVCGQNPLLADAALGHFDGHLTAGSPAVNMGTASGAPAEDYDGVPRSGLPDIGAYELASGCTVSCTASASPTAGSAPLQVAFTGTATATGCTGTPAFSWAFGDGATSTDQSPAHTYATDGSYAWTLTVTVDARTCAQSGTVTVTTCQMVCTADASPATGYAPLVVQFSATAGYSNCGSIEADFSWAFGDGATSQEQMASHTYAAAGSYTWTMTATLGDDTCAKTGTVVVLPPGTHPPGDCDADGSVSIGEVQKAINMFLGLQAVGCGVDCNGDGVVSIGEVQKVINAFLGLTASC